MVWREVEGSLKQREMGFNLSFREIPWQLWDGWMGIVGHGESRPVAREPPGKTGLCPWGWGSRHRCLSGDLAGPSESLDGAEGAGNVRISRELWMGCV